MKSRNKCTARGFWDTGLNPTPDHGNTRVIKSMPTPSRSRLPLHRSISSTMVQKGRFLRQGSAASKSQKRSLCAAEPDRDDIAQARATRQTDIAGVGEIASERLVFLDNFAVLTTMARRYGAAHVASGRLRKSPLATGSG